MSGPIAHEPSVSRVIVGSVNGTGAAIALGMRPRFVIYTVIATLMIGAVAVVADALFVTDREQLEGLADEIVESEGQPADAVLRWTDPSREPVSVIGERFEEQDDYALAERMADALAPLSADDLDLVQRSVDVRGDRGTVALRVRTEGETHDATLRLARSGQGWLVTDVQVR